MKGQSTATQRERTGISIKHGNAEGLLNRIHDAYQAIARRAYEIFDHDGRGHGRDLEHWLRAESEIFHPIHFVVKESKQAVNVRAEVPGFTDKDLEVSVEPRRLVISGQRETEEEHATGAAVYYEQCSGQIFRALDLPADVEPSKAKATLKDGILSIVVPKAASSKTVVEVKTA